MNDVMINFLMSVTTSQLEQMMQNSGLSLEDETLVGIVETEVVIKNQKFVDQIKVKFAYRDSCNQLMDADIYLTMKDNKLNLDF